MKANPKMVIETVGILAIVAIYLYYSHRSAKKLDETMEFAMHEYDLAMGRYNGENPLP